MIEPRGIRTSRELTDVRAVLTRAETTAEYLEESPTYYAPDPDRHQMAEDMARVVEILAKYRRTGRPKRGR
ncbi:hypothetical protein [Streptomyces sp. 6N106]|uniref:hypothetical protein n=1 Tax=Streptomyces sp. 6N106 TaxID=3457418 RepID=UPI003FD2F43D